ncbi:spermatogenesis-associated protein 1 isoform X2 [Nelusetta ayraudi]|uniref:spermatogenesis-associated protein 1 isoform X2 n=1 Tax=Nelusetta ayraudi TaxID=303726 RepID=UPI003F6F5BD9
MDLSWDSLRFPQDTRPASCKFVELHVLYVPDDYWDVKLHKVPAEAIERFISAGFIRVDPDITLKTLRSELGGLLGAERRINKFSFLKCVGRSLALVKKSQESGLKVKTFAPPYAPQPELYLLPTVENDGSVCSQSFTPDTSSSSPDRQTYYLPPRSCILPAGTKESTKFQLAPQRSHQSLPCQLLEEVEEEEEKEDKSFSSPGEEEEDDHGADGLSSSKSEWAELGCWPRQRSLQENAAQRCEGDAALLKELSEKSGASSRNIQYRRQNTESGAHPFLDDRDPGFSCTRRPPKPRDTNALRSVEHGSSKRNPVVSLQPVGCVSPCPVTHSVSTAHRTATATTPIQHRIQELVEELKQARDQRKQLEWKRQELLRKGKDLLSQNRHRRNQVRDSWKKKYFETKKATAALEERLKNLQQELEATYNKLLHQLQARDNRGKPKRQGRSSVKNELIIQIMTESHEIDSLKRKIEDAKMKLITEIKLRKQAAMELKDLKAELVQKRNQSSGTTASLGLGTNLWDKP